MRCAIIDLGSNTFHLLIVDVVIDKFQNVYRERVFTRLGDGGIDILSSKAIEFALQTAKSFRDVMDHYTPDSIMITGTAALRTASNRDEFILPAEEIFKCPINIIDGDKEAKLIFKGVKLLSPMIERSLIMDIGGGSTEFIIVENGVMQWARSYKLGVGVLHNLFHNSEPIGIGELLACKHYIKTSIEELLVEIEKPIHTLIGASGSFEIFESMTGKITYENEVNEIDIATAQKIIKKIVTADLSQRSKMEGLPADRTKLIVVGMILVDILLELVHPAKLVVTPYALKEGLLSEMNGL